MNKQIIKLLTAIMFLIVVQCSNVATQTSPEIERLTAEIAKHPEFDSLYAERGLLYTWNGKFYDSNAKSISSAIDENRAKALADADMALKINSNNYKAYYIRGLVDYSTSNFEKAAELKSKSNIIGNVYQADYSSSKIIYPTDLVKTVAKAIVVKGDERTKTVFDSLLLAKEFSKQNKQANVIILDKQTKKYSLYEAIIGENSPVSVQLAETPFRKALNNKPSIPINYESLKISPDYSLQLLPPLKELRTPWWEVADIVDTEGLSLIKKSNMQLMPGSNGMRLLFDSEIEKSNFDEALKIYQWLEKLNSKSNDLDVVKITRKTNLSKMFQAGDKLKPLVEMEMEKWKYTEAEKQQFAEFKNNYMNQIMAATFATFILSLAAFGQASDLLSPTAKAAFEKENYEPCITELSKIIVREPKNSIALTERARCYFFGSDSNVDFDRLEKIYLSKPNADKSKAGKAVNDQITELRTKAETDIEKSLNLNPNQAAAYKLRGFMKWLSDKNEEAIADYTKAIEIEPKSIKAYLNRGNSKVEKQDYDGAIADYSKVIEFEPNNILALKQRSYAFTSKNKGAISREAVSDLLKLTRLEPNNKKHYEIIESLCLNSAYPYTWGDIFKEYIADKPNSAEGHLGLARSQASVEIYYDLDKKEQYWKTGEDAYLKAIELNPTVIEPYIELFELYFNKLRSKLDSKVMATRTVAKFPNEAQSYILSGKLAESNKDWAMAMREFSRAIELNPKLSLAYERRSNAYGGLKEFDKAFADLNKAIEIDPRNGSAYLARGHYFSFQNKYNEAIADYTEADKLNITCAKTGRGSVYSKMAFVNKEPRDTGNFSKARQDFLSENAQKCYQTNFQYGIMLYAQRFDKEAVEQFDFALSVYKKHGYDTAEIMKWKSEIAKSTPAPKASNSGVDDIIAAYKSEAIKNGSELLGSGVYDYSVSFDPKMNFKVEKGKTYVFVGIKEYDPTFRMDIISDGRNIVRPTNRWDDKGYEVSSKAQYAMKFELANNGNYSIFRMNFGLTKNSGIRDIQFSPAGKVKSYHWLFFKLR